MRLRSKVQGFYKIEAIKAKSGTRRLLADWFPNLITTSGLDALLYSAFMYRCAVGTDSSTPTASDVALGNQVALTTSIISQINEVNSTSPYYCRHVKVYRFDEGVAAGNLSEVGIFSGNGSIGYPLFSRALILDTYGNPTTITVLSDEYLEVTYEFRYYPYESDVTGSITFTGNIGGTYSYTIRPAVITSLIRLFGQASTVYPACLTNKDGQYYSADAWVRAYEGGDLGTIFQYPTGTPASLDIPYNYINHDAYVGGSKELYLNIQAAPDYWNFTTGIQCIAFQWGFRAYQVKFTPTIPKTSEDVLKLKFIHTWDLV